jgi:hypothetical protein
MSAETRAKRAISGKQRWAEAKKVGEEEIGVASRPLQRDVVTGQEPLGQLASVPGLQNL